MARNLKENGMGTQTFLWGAAIVAFSHILVKVIGAVFKIPLDRFILHDEGIGIYNASYTIYNWLFVLSTAGLPVAISKMVSAACATGNYKEANRIFRIAKVLMFCLGLGGALLLFFGAGLFSELIHVSSTKYSIMVLAPSLFFTAMMSAYRGYTQGMNNMIPTAASEIVEALGKLCVGLGLASYCIGMGVEYGVAGAIGGVTIGTACGFVLLWIYNRVIQRRLKRQPVLSNGRVQTKGARAILKQLIVIAFPVTLGASVFTLSSLIDTVMINNQLAALGYKEMECASLFGYLSRAVTMFNVPPTVIAAISISVVPAISAAISTGQRHRAVETAKSALRITSLFSFPCAVGLSVLAEPIFQFVYGDAAHSFLLNVMGLAVACVTLVQTGNAVLQAYGKVWTPVINMAVGGVVKVVVNLLLVSQPAININGAPIGTFLCYFTVMVLNLLAIKKATGVTYEFSDFVIKPLFSVLAMGAATMITYDFVLRTGLHYLLAMGAAIGVAVIVYGAMILLVRCIKKEDLLLVPRGEKIYEALRRLHLMK